MLFAGGDQELGASCPCWSQSVLVGMANQDTVGEADMWVDAGGRRTGLGVVREHGGARARAAQKLVGMPGAAPGFRQRRHWGKRCVVGWRSRGSQDPARARALGGGGVGLRRAGKGQAEPLGAAGEGQRTPVLGCESGKGQCLGVGAEAPAWRPAMSMCNLM